jgi:P-type conjugative transfer protein TrbJ
MERLNVVVAVGMCVCLVAAPIGNARAGLPVVDPTNLVENATTATSQVKNAVQQAKTVKKQIEQLKQLKKDLEQLRAGDLKELEESFRQLKKAYEEGKQISMEWKRIGEQFDETYESFDPEKHDQETYYEKRREWQKQTDRAMRSAMKSHGVVEEFEGREEALEELVEKSDDAEGTLAAIQAGNRIAALVARQLQELNGLIVADSRARLSHMKERQEQEKAEGRKRKQQIMKGYGEESSYEKPEGELPEIQ